jgi:hypothetical protein
MSYVGNVPTTAAFPFDQFNGDGSTTAFTLSYAPAGSTSIIVAISGVVQNPNTYSVSGTTLTFTPAPPTGTSNIAVLYLGLPVVATLTPGNTAYFSSSVFTATASQTVFTPSGTYQVGFINVIRNGSQLAPADYTATNGTTVTLANPCTAGDTVVIEVFNLTSLTDALPVTGGTVTGATTFNSGVNLAVSSGNVGIGTSSPTSKLTVDGAFSITGQGRSTTGWAVSADGSTFTPSGLNAIPNYGTGYITSTSFTTLAGFGGASFYTNQLERMRIDGSGNFMVGTTSPTARFTVAESGNAPASDFYTSGGAVGTPCMYVKKQPNDGTTSQVYIQFLYNNAGSGNGQINGNGSGAAAFGSYSDERLKENISDIPPQLENICALRPVEFDYKTGGHQVGFIAQEMQEVYPDVVGTASDEMLTITGWSKTEARLVKAIQEQQQMIETLQAKVAALEAGQ